MGAELLLSICNACAAFWVLTGASWALIEGFGEAFAVLRDGAGVFGKASGLPGGTSGVCSERFGVLFGASGLPGEADLGDERGDWDI